DLNEEQQQIKQSVREFAEGEIAPHVREWDETQHFPVELLPKLAAQGFMGVIFPEQYGGAGLGYVEYVTIIEELSRVDGSVGISIAAHNSLCSNHIFQFGTEEQKQKFLVPLARGEKLGAWGLTEPGAGSDASGTRTTAVKRRAAGSLTARRISSRTRFTQTSASLWLRPTARCVQRASPRLSSRKACAVSSPARKRTSWGCARPRRRASSLKIAACPTRTGSAPKVSASSKRCRFSTAGASRLLRSRSVLRKAHTNLRLSIQRSANSSARQSQSFKRSSSNSQTWRRRLTRRVCSPIARLT